ncbi:MAG: DNA polymerase III subunit delta' [Burkholderiaceae bacterium]
MAGGEPLPVGVDAQGRLPLPWLHEALHRAQQLETSHALLLHAGLPSGQFELAQALSQGWLCEREPAPCGACTACRLVRTRTHPDHKVVVPDALRVAFDWLADDDPLLRTGAKPSRELRVEQVREAIEWSQRSAGSRGVRALVVHPGDALNLSAANALLKTLEEPPGGLRIVLTSQDPERLLPTLRSRVQRVRVPLPSAAQAIAWLGEQGVEQGAAVLAAAGGSAVEALELVNEGIDASLLANLPAQVARGDASALQGKPIPRVVDLLLKLAHDAMVALAGGTPRFFVAGPLPPGARLDALQRWRIDLLRAARHDEHPWNASLLIEALVTNGARCWAPGTPARPRRGERSIHSSG